MDFVDQPDIDFSTIEISDVTIQDEGWRGFLEFNMKGACYSLLFMRGGNLGEYKAFGVSHREDHCPFCDSYGYGGGKGGSCLALVFDKKILLNRLVEIPSVRLRLLLGEGQ